MGDTESVAMALFFPWQQKFGQTWLLFVKEAIYKEEFGMMTKQAELKKQAYASKLKSRALSVLLYLIDRSNKELTCFPAIPTMAEQLHISVSTVKRALHELLESGYIKKDARYREKNKGQTSNLYTLVLFERQMKSEDSYGSGSRDCAEGSGLAERKEVEQEKADEAGLGTCQVEHISFGTLTGQKEVSEAEKKEMQRTTGNAVQENHQDIRQKNKTCNLCAPSQIIMRFCAPFRCTEKSIQALLSSRWDKLRLYLWTGEGFSLRPP